MVLLAGAAGVVLGVVQTVLALSGGNGVWLHLESGGPGTALGGLILGGLGGYLLREERRDGQDR